jgi:hypothetical protein
MLNEVKPLLRRHGCPFFEVGLFSLAERIFADDQGAPILSKLRILDKPKSVIRPRRMPGCAFASDPSIKGLTPFCLPGLYPGAAVGLAFPRDSDIKRSTGEG